MCPRPNVTTVMPKKSQASDFGGAVVLGVGDQIKKTNKAPCPCASARPLFLFKALRARHKKGFPLADLND
jgi:hypothetical protein